MKRRIVTLMLALCMAFSLMGIQAHATQTLRDELINHVPEKDLTGKWSDQEIEFMIEKMPVLTVSPAAAGDNQYKESEPNDSLSNANVIYNDYTVLGTIEGEDIDGYVFELETASQVTIVSACITDGLLYGLFDVETQELLAESAYMGQDEDTGLYMDLLQTELPAGVYCVVFLDYYKESLEYLFYFEVVELTHEHEYDVEVVEATCTEGGYTIYMCSCGDSYMDDETDPLGHNFEGAAPVPHENGVQHCFDCSRCAERRYEDCDFSEEVTKEPTATEEGVKTYTCDICGNSHTESIPKLEEEEKEIASGTCGENMTWVLTEDGVLVISGNGSMTDYNPPRKNAPWLEYADQIIEVVVSEGVTDFGDFAFYQLDNARKITLPDTLKTIGDGAFGFSGFEEITIPAAVENLNGGMFESCFSLKKIVVHKDNAAFSSDAQGILYNKNKTTLIYCPQGFVGKCSIPQGVEQIADSAFHYCDKLTSVTVPGSVKSIGYFSFAGCYALESVTLNEGLEVISQEAFYDCRVLIEISIPAGVKTIGEEAFSCSGLETVWFKGDAPEIAPYVFTLVTATAYYPEGNTTWTEEVLIDYNGELTWVPYGESIDRIFGDNRVLTSFAVADALKETLGITKFDAVILASGDNFADALAGSFLASEKKAPILLYRAGFEDELLEYIQENMTSGGKVYILGGIAAVPQVMEDTLKGLTVKRLSGDTRFETNMKILEEGNVAGEEILIVKGWEYADSLSASATGCPVLLVNTITGELTDSQIAFLRAHADNTYTVIGGTSAVSEDMKKTIEAVIGREVSRVFGETREETSMKVAMTYFDSPDFVLLTYSRNFPDGLCGGPLAHAMGAPLLLIDAGKEAYAAAYVKENGIKNGAILGGTAVVSEASGRVVFGLD